LQDDNSKLEGLDIAAGTKREAMVNSDQQNDAVKNLSIHCHSSSTSGDLHTLELRIICEIIDY
jgi:hypothetical protein